MHQIKLLSIVVPCYKQEKTIQKNLLSLTQAISDIGIPYEIILVIDGKVDKTYEKVSGASFSHSVRKVKRGSIRVFQYEKNQGKGYAVKFGMLKAKGDIIGFIDAGMEIDPESIIMLLNHMRWYNADIILGSKLHPVSQVEYPHERKVLSWGYRNFTRALFGFKVRDTQVGLKLFRRIVVKDVFPKLHVKKFAFDIEILALSYSLGYTRIFEAPVRLNFKKSSISSTNFWRIIGHMMWDTLGVYYRMKKINRIHNKKRKRSYL